MPKSKPDRLLAFSPKDQPDVRRGCTFCALGEEARADLVEIMDRNKALPMLKTGGGEVQWVKWTRRRALSYFREIYGYRARTVDALDKHVWYCLGRNWVE